MGTFNLTDIFALRHTITHKRYLGGFIIFAILSLLIFRASYQSIVHDEAVTYNLFVSQGLPAIFLTFNSNNHTLNTFLMWLSTSIFGLSVFSLRLPALMGGAVYLITAERICNLSFKSIGAYAAALLVLTTSPFLLDFMMIARGYSLALGFLMLALWFVWKHVSAPPKQGFHQEVLISILAALSVSANLSFAFVNTALLLAYSFWMAVAYYRKELSGKQLTLKYLFLSIPGGLLYLIITPSIFYFSSETLYFGTGSWRRTFDSITMEFFDGFRPSLLPENWQQLFGSVAQYLPYCFILLIVLAGIALLPKYFRNLVSNNPLEQADYLWLLIALNLLFTVILLSAARLFFGILLPRERTGIYFVPLFILLTCLSIANLPKNRIQKIFGAIGQLCLLATIIYFGFCLRVNNTRQWVNDAGGETTFNVLLSTLKQYPGARVAANWQFEPALNFYRTLYKKTDTLKRFTRRADYDEFRLLVLLPNDQNDHQYISSHPLKVLYTSPESGAIIALNNQR